MGSEMCIRDSIGTLALILEDYELANKSWAKMRELEPTEWRVISKLAQANKGLGDIEAFNEYREELVNLHKEGTNLDLAKQDRFLVEQMPMDSGRIYIYQYFAPLSNDLAIFYQAALVDKNDKLLVRASLGSYKSTNEIHQSLSSDSKERMYHFDLYEKDGSHRLISMLPSENPIQYEKAIPVLINSIKNWFEAK